MPPMISARRFCATYFARVAFIWLSAFAASTAAAGINSWSNVGPYGGDIRAIAFGAGASPPAYALSKSGLYRSLDGGQVWSRVGGMLEPTHLAVHPTEGSTVFALVSGDLHSSTDSGATFAAVKPSATTPDFDSLQVSADGSTLYATAGRIVYRSANRGVDWQAGATTPASSNPQLVLVVDRVDALRLVVHAGDAIFASLDGGVSWSTWSAPPDYVQSFAFGAGARRWVGTATRLYYTDNNGASYTAASVTGFIRGLGVQPADPNVVYATVDNLVHRSADNGVQWTLGGGTIDLQQGRQLAFEGGSAGRVLMASKTGVWGSTDGIEWSRMNYGILATTISHLAVGTDSQRAYFAVDAQIYSLDAGAPSPVALNGAALRMVFPTAQRDGLSTLYTNHSGGLIVGSSAGGLASSVDNGQSWTLATDPYIVAPTVTHELASTQGFGFTLAATSEGVLRSIDGINWSRTSGIPGGTSIQRVKVASSTIAWASSFSRVYRSVDGGVTWAPVDAATIAGAVFDLTLGVPATDVAYVSAANDVYRTTNGGASWDRLTELSGGGDVPRIVVDGAKSMFAGSGGLVRFSPDGGSTWMPLPRTEGSPMWSSIRKYRRLANATTPGETYGVLLGATYDRGLRVFTPASDLSVAVSGTVPTPPGPGTHVVFEVTLTNGGPYALTNVYLDLASNRRFASAPGCVNTPLLRNEMHCNVDDVAAGSTKRLTFTVEFDTAGDIDVRATAATLFDTDSNFLNNEARIVVGYTPPPPPPAQGGGGGGGSLSPWLLALLALGALTRSRLYRY